MTTETSSPLVSVLAELSRLYPEMRFGQLVEMIALLAGEETPISVDEVDDERFVEAAFRHMSLRRQDAGIEDRTSSRPSPAGAAGRTAGSDRSRS